MRVWSQDDIPNEVFSLPMLFQIVHHNMLRLSISKSDYVLVGIFVLEFKRH